MCQSIVHITESDLERLAVSVWHEYAPDQQPGEEWREAKLARKTRNCVGVNGRD